MCGFSVAPACWLSSLQKGQFKRVIMSHLNLIFFLKIRLLNSFHGKWSGFLGPVQRLVSEWNISTDIWRIDGKCVQTVSLELWSIWYSIYLYLCLKSRQPDCQTTGSKTTIIRKLNSFAHFKEHTWSWTLKVLCSFSWEDRYHAWYRSSHLFLYKPLQNLKLLKVRTCFWKANFYVTFKKSFLFVWYEQISHIFAT